MDKQLLFPSSSHLDYKLTKSASFSELSSKKKVIIEKQFQTPAHGSLFKQYSCEEIFDKKTNTSQIKLSQTYKTDNTEQVDTWEKTVPAYYDSSKKTLWFNTINQQTNLQAPLSKFGQNHTLTETNDSYSKAIILPAKLVIDDNKMNQLSIKEEINFGNEKQVYLNNENINKPSNYLFKKPLLVNENSESGKGNDIKTPQPLNSNKRVKLTRNEENRQHKLDTFELKRRLRSLIAIEPKRKSNTQVCWSLTFFILLPIAIVSLALVVSNINASSSFCTPRFKFKTIVPELQRRVYDQDVAISKLTKFFDEKDNQTSFEVIAFVGGIGVGKSYTADIIKNHVKDSDIVLDVFPPLYNKENQIYRSLSVCRCNLIIFENLKIDDIVDTASFISNLKSRAENYCTLVLALFNTEEVDHNLKRTIDYTRSISTIKDKFGEVSLQLDIVDFTSLSNEALLKCIKDAGDYSKVKLSKDNIDYVMRDLLTAESGCKGAYAKVQVVGNTLKNR